MQAGDAGAHTRDAKSASSRKMCELLMAFRVHVAYAVAAGARVWSVNRDDGEEFIEIRRERRARVCVSPVKLLRDSRVITTGQHV